MIFVQDNARRVFFASPNAGNALSFRGAIGVVGVAGARRLVFAARSRRSSDPVVYYVYLWIQQQRELIINSAYDLFTADNRQCKSVVRGDTHFGGYKNMMYDIFPALRYHFTLFKL
jgi:hypothetical protein